MGSCMSNEPEVDFNSPVDFNHFHILRAIGKGAFGKVCIVKKKDTKQMYAMKYMNKIQIIRKHAVENVFREIKILCSLDHPFLVNLWFTFQDREDMFMVLDLMLGGDISYHLEKHGKFTLERVKLYVAEGSLALEYLRSKKIIHRDIKPANMLLDSQGHVHLTDFNVATYVRTNVAITSTTGTKPYMAPEVVQPPSKGYSYSVDWWSLGVSAYEMLRGHRPFMLEKNMSTSAIYQLLVQTRPSASVNWDNNTCDVLKMLLHPDSSKRLQTADSMKKHPFFKELNWEEVERKETVPAFIPPQNRINCDPTHELEEMIVEPNPLHKKRNRLSKRNMKTEEDAVEIELEKINSQFREYDRQKENEKEDTQRKSSSVERLLEEAYSNTATESGSCGAVSSQHTGLGVRLDTGSTREDATVSKEVIVVAEVSIPSESEPSQKDASESKGTASEEMVKPEGESKREEEGESKREEGQEREDGETGGGGEASVSAPPTEVAGTSKISAEDNSTSPSLDQAKEPASPSEVAPETNDTTPLLSNTNNTNAAHSEQVAATNELSVNSVQKTEEDRTIPAEEGTNNLRDSSD